MHKLLSSVIISLLLIFPVFGKDIHHLSDDLSTYYESLETPFNSNWSCCGIGDAYWADHVDNCKPEEYPNEQNGCFFVAIITDTRPDNIQINTVAGSKVIKREHIPVGTRYPIGKKLIRSTPIPNPTGHTIIFINSSNTAICYEPSSGS